MVSNQRYLSPYCLARSQRRLYQRIGTLTLTPETRENACQNVSQSKARNRSFAKRRKLRRHFVRSEPILVDAEGGHWVPVRRRERAGVDGEAARHRLVADTAWAGGERLVGFDNAHPLARQRRSEPQDHRHRLAADDCPKEYRDATTLLADFWETVDAVLRERGVIPWGAFERRPQPCETISALRAASACKVSAVSKRSAGSPVAAS